MIDTFVASDMGETVRSSKAGQAAIAETRRTAFIAVGHVICGCAALVLVIAAATKFATGQIVVPLAELLTAVLTSALALKSLRSSLILVSVVFTGFVLWQLSTRARGQPNCGCFGAHRIGSESPWVLAYDGVIVASSLAALGDLRRGSASRLAKMAASITLLATLALLGVVASGRRIGVGHTTVFAIPPPAAASTRPADRAAEVTPSVLNLGLIKVGDEMVSNVELANHSGADVTVNTVEIECIACTAVDLKVPVSVKSGASLRVPVHFTAKLTDLGPINRGVMFKLSVGPPLLLAIRGQIVEFAAVVPGQVSIAEIVAAASEKRVCEVSIRNFSNVPIRALYATWRSRGIRVSCPTEPIPPDGIGRVRIELCGNGPITADEIEINIDHPTLHSLRLVIK